MPSTFFIALDGLVLLLGLIGTSTQLAHLGDRLLCREPLMHEVARENSPSPTVAGPARDSYWLPLLYTLIDELNYPGNLVCLGSSKIWHWLLEVFDTKSCKILSIKHALALTRKTNQSTYTLRNQEL
jgi:hypothetical protein